MIRWSGWSDELQWSEMARNHSHHDLHFNWLWPQFTLDISLLSSSMPDDEKSRVITMYYSMFYITFGSKPPFHRSCPQCTIHGAVLVAKCCKPATPPQWACDQLRFLISLIIIINGTCYLCYHKESFRWRQTQGRKLLNFVEKLKAFSPSECHLLSPVRTLQLIPH